MTVDATSGAARLPARQGISWPYAAAIGSTTGAAATLFHLGASTAGAIAMGLSLVLCLGPLIRRPKQHLNTGTVVRVPSEADHPESVAWRLFLPAAGVLLAGLGLEPLSLEPLFAAPLYFVAVSAALTWAVRRSGSENHRVTRRRTQAALGKADLMEATVARLTAVETHRDVVSGLFALGAVDGIQVRLWRLAEELGEGVDALRWSVSELSRCGVVRTSAVDAGGDPARGLVELTPVGVRVTHELQRR